MLNRFLCFVFLLLTASGTWGFFPEDITDANGRLTALQEGTPTNIPGHYRLRQIEYKPA
jgi:hypothetical protein